jgi:hypothetical protein
MESCSCGSITAFTKEIFRRSSKMIPIKEFGSKCSFKIFVTKNF